VDRTVYTDLASRVAASFLLEGTALERDDHFSLALAALEFLWSESFRPGEGMAHYHDGKPHRWGLLDDGVEAALAFLAAFGYTGERRYLERAGALLAITMADHWDGTRSLFMDASPHHLPPGLRPQPAELGSQSRAAEAMLLYWSYSGEEEWHRRAGEVLTAASGMAAAYGIMASPFATAVNLYLRGPVLVKISGGPGHGASSLLRLAAFSPQARILPAYSLKVGIMEEAWSEVCSMVSCRLRTSDPEALARDLGVLEEISKGVDHEGSLPG
jgi:uncharacterized protein YyaL (SSP411 family)